MQQFKKDVEAASKGSLVIEVFDNMQLGGAQENVTQTRAGTIHMTWVGMAFLSRTVPELEAVSLPFMFPSREVAYKVMDGPAVDLIEAKMARQGLHLAGFHGAGRAPGHQQRASGADHGRPQGLKIRMQPNETHLATFKALGANPLAMDIKEVYSALEQKVIDGHENPLCADSHQPLQRSAEAPLVTPVISSTSFGGGQQEEDRVAVGRAPEDRAHRHDQLPCLRNARVATKADAESLAELQKKGMTYTEMPASEREAMRKATAARGGRRAQAPRRRAGRPGAGRGQEGRRLTLLAIRTLLPCTRILSRSAHGVVPGRCGPLALVIAGRLIWLPAGRSWSMIWR
jgi:hypothetical protein